MICTTVMGNNPCTQEKCEERIRENSAQIISIASDVKRIKNRLSRVENMAMRDAMHDYVNGKPPAFSPPPYSLQSSDSWFSASSRDPPPRDPPPNEIWMK